MVDTRIINLTRGGYDAAQSGRENDDLDRWRFAREVIDVILSTPSPWSVRIGIFGKWGEGKSTVLHFAEQMLLEKGSIVFSFNPWAVQNWNDLWEEFGSRLVDTLSAANIPFESPWKNKVRNSGKRLKSVGLDKIAETTAAALGREKLYSSAFGLLSNLLKYDSPQISAIRKTLGDKRLVVLIDDLDRCTPELLSKLLLSLRELLDLPGFTFLLAFDDEIVARALKEENPAWAQGSNFLEKILDFRFYLPAITDPQKKRLIARAMTEYCPFVPLESVTVILDLLPNNPRKLKALVRSLAALRPQLSRHDPDELNWVDMWLAQMLRLESYAFFEALLKGNTLESIAGTLYKLMKVDSWGSREKKGEQQNESLKNLAKDAGVTDPLTIQRLIELIEATRSRASFRFKYVCELAVRPHAITWKEFRRLYSNWVADPRSTLLASWIKQQAEDRGVSLEDVDQELFETLMARKQELLSSAAESESIQEHDSYLTDASRTLKLLEQFLLDLEMLDGQRFGKLYGQALYWIGFRKNPTDRALRQQEETLLLKILFSSSGALSTELLEVFIRRSDDPDFGDGTSALRGAIHDKCLEIVAPKAATEALEFFKADGGIRSLTEQGRFVGVKYCLFNPDSPVWKTDLGKKLIDLLVKRGTEPTIYANVREFLHLLAQGLDNRLDSISHHDVRALISNAEFVGCMWRAVTSRGIQYRMQIAFLRMRQLFIDNGASEAALPLTEALQSRLNEDKTRAFP